MRDQRGARAALKVSRSAVFTVAIKLPLFFDVREVEARKATGALLSTMRTAAGTL